MERRTRSYLQLIKPGITLSNTLTGIAGFFLAASVVPFSLTALIGVVIGIPLVIASACVFNNILDRDIDKRMKRTAKRDVAAGVISIPKALVFGSVIGLGGFITLLALTNTVTLWLGVIAFLWYVVIYGYTKRNTPLSTIIGGVAGSLPPAAGYTALVGQVDMGAIVLFLILFFWQLPHFYAIAMFRRDDYASAKIPVWSVVYGLKSTQMQIVRSVILYAFVVGLLTLYGYTGIFYLIVSVALAVYWLVQGIRYYNKLDEVKWAHKMFGISLMVLLAMCVLIAIGGFLP